ncbi:hypothetical protein ALC62_08403 [Cyphomyrmex costatus]|uniref:Uncharacterized protein n=1 Tax=Cyphomyrmex costatus TaxID=456900 RepID=A0A195CJ01_9HYME|nr:hypothetical protein ALC62_08403 [Cyphomyrmex costatus]
MYQVNIISEYSETIKLAFAQNKSSVYILLSVSRKSLEERGKWRCASSYETELPQVRAEAEIVLKSRRKGIKTRERKTIRSYVRIYTCYSTSLRVLDWIGLPRQQYKHSEPRCGIQPAKLTCNAKKKVKGVMEVRQGERARIYELPGLQEQCVHVFPPIKLSTQWYKMAPPPGQSTTRAISGGFVPPTTLAGYVKFRFIVSIFKTVFPKSHLVMRLVIIDFINFTFLSFVARILHAFQDASVCIIGGICIIISTLHTHFISFITCILYRFYRIHVGLKLLMISFLFFLSFSRCLKANSFCCLFLKISSSASPSSDIINCTRSKLTSPLSVKKPCK